MSAKRLTPPFAFLDPLGAGAVRAIPDIPFVEAQHDATGDLRPGDYVFGWDVPHGPYEYPDGCEVFIVYMGDATHVWEAAQHLAHKNIWKPKTAVGKKGAARHVNKREAGQVRREIAGSSGAPYDFTMMGVASLDPSYGRFP